MLGWIGESIEIICEGILWTWGHIDLFINILWITAIGFTFFNGIKSLISKNKVKDNDDTDQ